MELHVSATQLTLQYELGLRDVQSDPTYWLMVKELQKLVFGQRLAGRAKWNDWLFLLFYQHLSCDLYIQCLDSHYKGKAEIKAPETWFIEFYDVQSNIWFLCLYMDKNLDLQKLQIYHMSSIWICYPEFHSTLLIACTGKSKPERTFCWEHIKFFEIFSGCLSFNTTWWNILNSYCFTCCQLND